MFKKIFRLAAAATFLTAAVTAHAGVLTGGTVGIKGFAPNLGTETQDFGTAVVGAGAEFPAGGFSAHTFDLGANALNITFDVAASGTWDSNTFNGFVISDIGDSINDMVGVTLIGGTGYIGGNALDVSFNSDQIFINFSGRGFAPGYSAQYSVEVPAPAPLALMVAGLLLLGVRRARPRS